VFHNGATAKVSVDRIVRYLADVLLVKPSHRVDPG
jgi:hypothetical protein